MWSARVVFLVLSLFLVANSKNYDTRCKLVRDLLKNGVPKDHYLGTWVCLIEQESKRNTSALVVKNGKKYYGLYQIPNVWCKEGKRGGDCNVACESLLDDNIKEDIDCASKIRVEKGFKYWSKWEYRCKNNINFFSTEIYKCADLLYPTSNPERMTSSDMLMHRMHRFIHRGN